MARNAAGRDQNHVEPDVADARRRDGCASQAPAAATIRISLPLADRPFRRVVKLLARLDLDEHQQRPAPRDDVDLADRTSPAPRDDAKALGDQEGRRPALR